MIVYTCITNSKDALMPMNKEPGVRYVCFSDKPFTDKTWEYAPVELHGATDPRRIARRYKWLSHIYFPGQPTIWIDGRVGLRLLPSELMDKYKGDLVLRPHPSRTCIYQEAETVKKQNYEHHGVVDAQMRRYKKDGYPAMHGLNETGCIVRRPTDQVEQFNNAMWAEISAFSKRDQLCFNYLAWKLRMPVMQMQRDDILLVKHRIKTDVNR